MRRAAWLTRFAAALSSHAHCNPPLPASRLRDARRCKRTPPHSDKDGVRAGRQRSLRPAGKVVR
jgi:hypothetical protein